MLGKEIIIPDLTVIDLDVDTPNQVFDVMGKKFLEKGYVESTYIDSIKARESEYPTALPVDPYPIAIPHTDTEAITKPFIAPVRLKKQIAWGDMAEPDKTLDVRLVFLLGFKEPGAHIELLQILVHNFQRSDWVQSLYSANTQEEFFNNVVDMEWCHD